MNRLSSATCDATHRQIGTSSKSSKNSSEVSRAKLKSPTGEERGRRRTSLLFLLFLLLVPICLCVASQVALLNLFMAQADEGVGSRLLADYATWAPQAINPLRPELIGTIRADQLTLAANAPGAGTLVPFVTGPGGTQIAGVGTPTPTVPLSPSASATPATLTATATPFLVFFPATDTPAGLPSATLSPFFTNTPVPPPPTPIPQADLAITKTDGITTLFPGGGLTYTIVVRNNGPAQVGNARVQDTFPAAISLATWACSSSPGSNCDTASGSGSINVTVDLLVTGTATFTVTVTTNAASPGCGTLVNTATVTPPPTRADPNLANNTATDIDTFANCADLEITKTDSADPVMFGNTFTYTITVTNHGPDSAANVIVTDGLSQVNWPPVAAVAPTVNSVTPSQGGCAAFPCNLGTILSGNSATITVSVTANTAGPITNAVAVSSSATDPGVFSNSASEPTDVRHKIVIDLFWFSSTGDTTADLDLIVVDASGQSINRFTLCDVDGINCLPAASPSNGEFSADVNCASPPGPVPSIASNNETAFWTTVGGPAGTYSITANYYQTCAGTQTIDWAVTVTVDNVLIQTYSAQASGIFFPPTTPLPGFPTTCTIGATVSCP